jgi:hypothetical protein
MIMQPISTLSKPTHPRADISRFCLGSGVLTRENEAANNARILHSSSCDRVTATETRTTSTVAAPYSRVSPSPASIMSDSDSDDELMSRLASGNFGRVHVHHENCSYCATPNATLPCTTCQSVFYCNEVGASTAVERIWSVVLSIWRILGV